LSGKFINDLGEKLVGDQLGVFSVRDNDAADGGGGTVSVEGVGFFFDILTGSRPRAFCDRFGEHSHEFAVAITCEAGEAGEVSLDGQLGGRLWVIAKNADIVQLHDGGGCVSEK